MLYYTGMRLGDFNPRSPCGERQTVYYALRMAKYISIHAPRAGSDSKFPDGKVSLSISIHAPRAGSDRTYNADGAAGT